MPRTIEKCFVCKKRSQIRRTYQLCSDCYKHVSPEAQKAIIENTLTGQEQGYIQPNEAFQEAMKLAIGDVYYHLFGARNPDKIVRDSLGQPIESNDLVEWPEQIDEEMQWGKVVAVYWESQEITVRWFDNSYPKSRRMPAKEAFLKRKRT